MSPSNGKIVMEVYVRMEEIKRPSISDLIQQQMIYPYSLAAHIRRRMHTEWSTSRRRHEGLVEGSVPISLYIHRCACV